MNDNNGRGSKFVGFLAFLVTMFAAVLYLAALVFNFVNISSTNFPIFQTLTSVAEVLLIVSVSVTGWKYVKTKKLAWKLIYAFVLLAVVATMVVPFVVNDIVPFIEGIKNAQIK